MLVRHGSTTCWAHREQAGMMTRGPLQAILPLLLFTVCAFLFISQTVVAD